MDNFLPGDFHRMTEGPFEDEPTPERKGNMTTEQRAVEIAEAITALPGDDDYSATAALFRDGEQDVFLFMDEKPGSGCFYHLRDDDTCYGRWHMRLRRCRNNAFDKLADAFSGKVTT